MSVIPLDRVRSRVPQEDTAVGAPSSGAGHITFRFAVFSQQTSRLVRVAQEAGASDEAIYDALFGGES